MPLLTKECLERLRSRINLAEIVGSHIDLKKVGGKVKALCPFHNEKTPSFTISGGDSHYHCFGCGAHGDGVAFLMNFLGLTFNEAIEYLANKYHVQLEYTGKKEEGNDFKREICAINQKTAEFFHFHLLHSEEAKPALKYLFDRGVTEDFIKKFMIGYAPKAEHFQRTFFRSEKFSDDLLVRSGILSKSSKRPFFSERITFPIHNGMGSVIGFSGRKINESVFGGKYVNTVETAVFKKSRTLFGLNYSRREIAKTGKVIVVEGQIDALRLIFEGFETAVASQGTAFGEDHVAELMKLGVSEVIVCFDGDVAGDTSAVKVGQFFQKVGVEVFICSFPRGKDPDTYLLEHGKEAFEHLLAHKKGFMTFLVQLLMKDEGANTPAGKNKVAAKCKKMMSEWKFPIMIHEGEKLLAKLLHVPAKYLVTTKVERRPVNKVVTAKRDPLDSDLLRWVFYLEDKELLDVIMDNINEEHVVDPAVVPIFSLAKELHQKGERIDLLHLGGNLREEQFQFMEEMKSKKMNLSKAETGVHLLCQRILDRDWIKRAAVIKGKMNNPDLSEEEVFALAKEFDEIKKNKHVIMEK